ncbi:exodeoxyribonuclease V subunit alpha [Desulfatibacillum aliphaticivorans]|uniref:exodeoxyribonuclease V subunit alpha n=1 Tax=Desulfatibacillum aliphaticivorans TaxID=218208 RepID=UPI000419A2D6|nr:exodeoxyribonuclease V subunit alpha [Desulfatibacillum aliphaticivorans]
MIEFEAIDGQFAAFLQKLAGGSDPVLQSAAALVSLRTREGHTCVELSSGLDRDCLLSPDCPENPAQWIDALANSPVVGAPGEYRPLILDQAGRLYLHRYYEDQALTAKKILEWSVPDPAYTDQEQLAQELDRLFAPLPKNETDWQKAAAATAVLRKFSVISGGPGTGKTTIAARIIHLLLSLADGRPPSIAISAPTGKAAARLLESLGKELSRLGVPPGMDDAIPKRAKTIHRLMGARFNSSQFIHNADNPINADILIVDEASMVELSLMARLLEALPDHGKLILLGDKDQLASVGPGSVMGDICSGPGSQAFSPEWAKVLAKAAGQAIPSENGLAPIADGIVHLVKNYRFAKDSGIGELADCVVRGDAAGAAASLESGGEIIYEPVNNPRTLPALLEEPLREGFLPFITAKNPAQALEAFGGFRVLCGVRQGPWGMNSANSLVEDIFARDGLILLRNYPWYEKRPVVVNRNDAEMNLFNGDHGVYMDGKAAFPGLQEELRHYARSMLPAHDTAFAMTVHKSQGSEFESVLLILPGENSPVLTRELLYTAVTRTRSRLRIVGAMPSIKKAVLSPTRRPSGLQDALWKTE